MEALFGYLELAGKRERMEELFFAAYADIIAELDAAHPNHVRFTEVKNK